MMPYGFPCCYSMCVAPPAEYTLTNMYLTLGAVVPHVKWLPWWLGAFFCGSERMKDTIELASIVDVVVDIPQNGCLSCDANMAYIQIKTHEKEVENRFLIVKPSTAEALKAEILHAVQEAELFSAQNMQTQRGSRR
jgi:hypothetical protein